MGLLIAVLADRSKYEKVAKSLIFMPMAISFVGASVIWNFIYEVKPASFRRLVCSMRLWSPWADNRMPGRLIRPLHPGTTFSWWSLLSGCRLGYAMVLFSAAIKGHS